MRKRAMLASVVLNAVFASAAEMTPELQSFFSKQMGLNEDEIANINRGTAVAKVLPSETPAEIFVFGAVFVHAAPQAYRKLAFDISRLRKLPVYLGIGRIDSPAKLADLQGFTLEPEDIQDLKNCRPGDCDVQLPDEAMQSIRTTVNWSAPDIAAQVNDKIRSIALDLLRRYQRDGNEALWTYSDKEHPFDVQEQLESWLHRSDTPIVYLPRLRLYLLQYPRITPPKGDSLFYWEKVDFGLKPTLRLNHAIAYESSGARRTGTQVIAVKQLYASHYFQLALDVTVCIPASGGHPGFYLITLKRSSQQGLTGFRGSILRKVVVGKTRSAQAKSLAGIKKALEQQP